MREAYFNLGICYIYLEKSMQGCNDLKIANEFCDDPLYERTLE